MMSRAACVAMLLVLSVRSAAAQESVYVDIETNFSEAVLYADSVLIGRVPAGVVPIPATTRSIKLVPPDRNSWSITSVSRSFQATSGDTVRIELNFPYHYRVESVPFGADVLIEDESGRRKLGDTPLLYRSARPLDGNLLVDRDGYAVERFRPGKEIWNLHEIRLNPSEDLDPTAAQVNWQPPKKHRAWIDYVALGTAVAAGALAVHYKFRADDLYTEYEETGDPSLQSNIENYDTRAAVAFGAMQAGVGVFALRLILR